MALGKHSEYDEARAHAQRLADDMGRTTSVERFMEYGTREVFLVGLIPTDPRKRFGRDARVEAVHPMTPPAGYWDLQAQRN